MSGSPEHPDPDFDVASLETKRSWTPGRIALQLAGLLIGIGLFAWAISMAVSPKNADAIAKLRSAQAWQVAALFGLSVASIVLNGLMFHVVLTPLKRLSRLDVVLTNAIAVFLAILPFKLGLLVRVAIHHRRDGVPFRDIVAWFAAISALALAVLVPMAAAGLWRGRIDALWWIVCIGGIVGISALAVVCGRLSDNWPLLAKLSLGSWRIVKHPAPVIGHGVFRVMDVTVLAARFIVAAAIVGQSMGVDDAVLMATVYFFLSAIIPTGNLGFREAGVVLLAQRTGMDNATMALVALVVTSGETLSALVMGAVGWMKLRPERVLGKQSEKRKAKNENQD